MAEDEGEAGGMLTADMAGRLLMVSGERIRQLAKEGWIAKAGHGKFFLVDVVQGYIRFRNDADRRSTKSASATRISDARAREIELRTALREKHLMQVDDHIATVDKIAGILRTKLGGLPARVTRDLQLRRTIETVVNETLQEISDVAAEEAHRAREAARADEAVTEDGAGRMGGDESDPSEHDGGSGSS